MFFGGDEHKRIIYILENKIEIFFPAILNKDYQLPYVFGTVKFIFQRLRFEDKERAKQKPRITYRTVTFVLKLN